MDMEDIQVPNEFFFAKPDSNTALVMRVSPKTVVIKTAFPSAVMRRMWNNFRNGFYESGWDSQNKVWWVGTETATKKLMEERLRHTAGYSTVEFMDGGVPWPEE